MNGEPSKQVVYQIKGVHLYLTVAVLLFTMGVAWATVQAQVAQNSRDIKEIRDEKYVPKADYWRDWDMFNRKLDTMDGKIDAITKLLK